MASIQIEGFILQTIKFQDYNQIATLFTPSHGLIKTIVKEAFKPKSNKALTSTLSQVEMICSPSKGEIWKCQEISPLNFHLKLRMKLETLEAALEMVQALCSTQSICKAAPELYLLFNAYLNRLPDFKQPAVLTSCFYLKLLRYEGLFNISSYCSVCQEELKECFFTQGESFCHKHQLSHALAISKEQIELINHLAFCLSFTELSKLEIKKELHQIIRQIFKELISLLT